MLTVTIPSQLAIQQRSALTLPSGDSPLRPFLQDRSLLECERNFYEVHPQDVATLHKNATNDCFIKSKQDLNYIHVFPKSITKTCQCNPLDNHFISYHNKFLLGAPYIIHADTRERPTELYANCCDEGYNIKERNYIIVPFLPIP